jgi:hypothetical protein
MSDMITTRMNELYRLRKAEVQALVERTHRIIDLRDASKDVLISYVLEAEFGKARLRAWNASR